MKTNSLLERFGARSEDDESEARGVYARVKRAIGFGYLRTVCTGSGGSQPGTWDP
jgi:hypothetical protein